MTVTVNIQEITEARAEHFPEFSTVKIRDNRTPEHSVYAPIILFFHNANHVEASMNIASAINAAVKLPSVMVSGSDEVALDPNDANRLMKLWSKKFRQKHGR